MPDNERQFEQDIESFLISPAGGWQKYGPGLGYPSWFYPDYPAHPVAAVREAVQLRC